MANGVNQVTLIGNLGDDPSVKFTQGGMAVAKMSVATTKTRKNKDGEKVEETQWHTVKAFGKLGEICGEYLHKGSKVYIQGEIRYSKVEGDTGTKYFTDIVANEMRMLDSKPQGERTTSAPPRQQRAPAPPADDFADDFTDDLPF